MGWQACWLVLNRQSRKEADGWWVWEVDFSGWATLRDERREKERKI